MSYKRRQSNGSSSRAAGGGGGEGGSGEYRGRSASAKERSMFDSLGTEGKAGGRPGRWPRDKL
eukprot:761492-Hanusia_phi.AAC.2